ESGSGATEIARALETCSYAREVGKRAIEARIGMNEAPIGERFEQLHGFAHGTVSERERAFLEERFGRLLQRNVGVRDRTGETESRGHEKRVAPHPSSPGGRGKAAHPSHGSSHPIGELCRPRRSLRREPSRLDRSQEVTDLRGEIAGDAPLFEGRWDV